MSNPLAIASIVIYVILLQPSLYCLWKHGWPGSLGWGYLQVFCLLRIIGNAIELQSQTVSEKTLIVSNIGLSPLLLATAGILHEARRARNPNLKSKVEWLLIIQYHMFVSIALGLIVAGVVTFEGGKSVSTAKVLMGIGAAALLVCWAVLFTWIVVSMKSDEMERAITPLGGGPLGMLIQLLFASQHTQYKNAGEAAYANGTKLLYAVATAILLVALRCAYSVGSLIIDVDQKPSTFSTSLAIKVILSVVPEMVLTLILCSVGIATRNIPGAFWSKKKGERQASERNIRLDSYDGDRLASDRSH